MIRDKREGGSSYKKPPLPPFTRAEFPNLFLKTLAVTSTVTILEFSAQAVVLTGGLSIEASIDWVHPRVPLRVSARILGLNIEAGIDWVYPRVPLRVSARILGLNIEAGIDRVNPRVLLRVSVHILDRIASNPSSSELSDFDYSADQLY